MKIGDVIFVEDIGQKATVGHIFNNNGGVECVWFDANNKLHRQIFSLQAIREVDKGGQ